MSHDVINFLPDVQVRAFRRTYLARLASTWAVAIALVVVAHVALLTPTYLYIENEHASRVEQLQILTAPPQEGQESLGARVEALSQNTKRLNLFLEKPRGSYFMQELLALPQKGVYIHALSIDVSTTLSNQIQMRVSGTASSREELRAYYLALSDLSFITSTDLPLSVYAKENDIPFSIGITGTITP
jgi:Tfp pilus assembly protein PilN